MPKTKKIHFWVNKSLLDKIELEAEKKGISRNTYIELMLNQHFELESLIRWCVKELKDKSFEND